MVKDKVALDIQCWYAEVVLLAKETAGPQIYCLPKFERTSQDD